MQSRLIWKLALIVLVLGVFAQALWPPSQTLNLGLDLRGGTSLVYEVDTEGVEDPREAIRQTIQVLQERVDPQGVRNLKWRIQAGNRIEIRMPQASEHVVERRETYRQKLEQIEDSAISRGEVLSALRADPDVRAEALKSLVRGVDGRLELLKKAAEAYDQLQEARQRLAETEEGTDKHVEVAGRVADAEIAFEKAVDKVMATNLSPTELGRVLAMSTTSKTDDSGEPIPGSSPRAQALEKLKQQHPQRAGQIETIVEAYDKYQQVKGPLDDPNDLIRMLQGSGVLEFRIAVAPPSSPDSQVGEQEVQRLRERLQERGPEAFGSDAPMRWFVVDDPSQFVQDEEQLKALKENPRQYFAGRGLIGAKHGGEYYLLLWNTPGKSLTQRQQGWELESASKSRDQRGLPAIAFSMNPRGANLLGELTSNNIDKPMAIVLDGRVYSAPNINSEIRGRGQISGGRGGFSEKELDYLIRTLSAGSLQARLSEEPISIRNIGPSMGQDNLVRGLSSARNALIAVAVFMLLYFFFAGFVADLALLANLIIILGVMATLQAVFTLPGIAGIVLTIGMCVDANVLVFERIREELRAGADMPTALRLGYQRAFSSIIDGNLTNLIVCFILGYTATAEVKGFAVTLGIGICATLFTSLFMSRVIFQTYYLIFGSRRRMSMLPSAVPAIERLLHPGINWIGKRLVFFTLSGALVIGALGLCYARGAQMLDIEFRAGTEVTFDLSGEQKIKLDEARQRLADSGLGHYNVVPLGEVDEKFRAGAFTVMTTVSEQNRVASAIRESFGDLLDVQPVVRFKGQDAEKLSDAPVYPITGERLGEAINRPAVENEAPEHLGGVAIVLENLDPPRSLEQLEQRIRTMRFQPDFQDVQYRPFDVIGLERAEGQAGKYTSAVVVSSDPQLSYFDDPEAWESDLAASEWQLVRQGLARETSLSQVSNYTPTVARTMANNAIVALLLSVVAIVAYIWFRFGSLRYGLAAIAALVHDVTITLGLIALSGYIYDTALGSALMLDPFKINMGLIAALLTIIGYSLNDTIVLFDRIRENRGKLATATPGIINDSINQVISRTALTSATTFIAVLLMYIQGGAGIHNFAFALVVGVIVGTYSSIAVASPLLLVGTKYNTRQAVARAPEQSDTVTPET